MRALLFTAAAFAALAGSEASAAVVAEKHLGTFGSPVEWRTRCDHWIRITPWDRTCVAHTYQNLQHSFTLRIDGPESVEEAARQVLGEALGVAASAAMGTGLLTPSPEPSARIAAAAAAAKTAFVGYLAARGLERMVDQYSLTIDHSTYW